MYKANIRASIYMMLAMAGFTLNDGLVKSIQETLNIGQIILLRGVIATGLLFLLYLINEHRKTSKMRASATLTTIDSNSDSQAGPSRSFWREASHPMVLGRAFFDVAATLAFLLALVHLPLAELSAILQALPLAVTLGAVLFMGEVVGWRRWMAILLGFAGVLVIIRPGMTGFSGYSVLALLAVVGAAARDLVTRKVPEYIPSLLVSAVTSLMVMLSGGVLMSVTGGWSAVTGALLLKIVCAGGFVMVGYHFVILSMRTGEISFIAPFRYTSLIWAIVLGYVWFGEIPDTPMLVGSALIVGTGLYAFHRERQLNETAN